MIDTLLALNAIPHWFVLVILAVIVFSRWITKRWTAALTIACVLFILGETLLFRKVGESTRFELRPFWSYGEWKDQGTQVIANIFMFLPLGILLGREKGWRVIPAAAMFSLGIELLQLVTKKGLFEFDDIFHNALGTAIGFGIVTLIGKAQSNNV